jgi:hypothetical protein
VLQRNDTVAQDVRDEFAALKHMCAVVATVAAAGGDASGDARRVQVRNTHPRTPVGGAVVVVITPLCDQPVMA